MRVIQFVLVSMLLLPAITMSQRLSPLFNVVAANSQIDRDADFRKMQDAISGALKNQSPGLRIQSVYDKFKEFRTAVVGRIRAFTVRVESAATQKMVKLVVPLFSNLGGLVACDTLSVAQDITWGALKEKMRAVLRDRTDSVLRHVLSAQAVSDVMKPEVETWLFSSLIASLKASGFAATQVPAGDSTYQQFAYTFASLVVDYVGAAVTQAINSGARIDITDATPISNLISSADGEFNHVLVEKFRTRVDGLAQALIDQLDKIESTIARASETVNDVLVAGHAGLAVSDSGGDTQAGVTFTWRPSDLFQLGIFTNLQLDAPTKKQTGPLMLGLQCRFTVDRTQFDLMSGATFRDSINSGSKTSYEGGFGVAVNSGTVIVGAVVTYLARTPLGDTEIQNWWSAGLQIRLPGTGRPSFTFAWNYNDRSLQNNGLPIVQVAFPIQSNP